MDAETDRGLWRVKNLFLRRGRRDENRGRGGGGEVFPFSSLPLPTYRLHLPYYYVLFAFKMAAWRDQCNPLLLEKKAAVAQAYRAELSVCSASWDMLLNPFSAFLIFVVTSPSLLLKLLFSIKSVKERCPTNADCKLADWQVNIVLKCSTPTLTLINPKTSLLELGLGLEHFRTMFISQSTSLQSAFVVLRWRGYTPQFQRGSKQIAIGVRKIFSPQCIQNSKEELHQGIQDV